MNEIAWIAIAVLCTALLLPVISKVLSKNERLFRNARIAVFVVYILIILYETLLTRRITHHVKYELSLFWSYRESLAFCEDGSGLVVADSKLLKQIILNILLYIPLGYLLPFAWPGLANLTRFTSRFRAINMLTAFPWIVVLIGVAFSVTTELTQLFFRLGLFELDDIFNNTIGCLIGVLLYLVVIRPGAKKAA